MKQEWLRKLVVASRPPDLVKGLEQLAGSLVNGEGVFLEYDVDGWCLRHHGKKVNLDTETLAGECALRGDPLKHEGNGRPAFPGQVKPWAHTLALPVRRFGTLAGVLLVGSESSAWPKEDLEELAEGFALLGNPVEELDRSRQALAQFQQLTVKAVEGLPGMYSGHVANVCQLTADLAEYLDLSAQARRLIWNAALYHDIGMLQLTGHISTEIEKRHAAAGSEFLEESGALAELAPLVKTHHERYDGTGLLGLKGDDLTIGQWVLALAEDFEDFMSLNPHMSFEAVVSIFFQQKSRTHHPDAVDALAGLVDSGRLDRLRQR